MTGRTLIVEDVVLVAVRFELALSAQGWDVETTDGQTPSDIIE